MVLGALLGPALSAAGPLLGLGGGSATATGAASAPAAGSATTGPINVTVSFNNVGNPYINVSADGEASGSGTGTGTGGAATSTSTAAAAATSTSAAAATSTPATSPTSTGPTPTPTPTTRPSQTPSGLGAATDPPKIALITEADFKDFSTQFLVPLIQQVNTLRNQVDTLRDEVKTLNEKAAASESRSSRAVTYRARTDGTDWSQTITDGNGTMLISEQVNFTGPVMLTYTAHVEGPTNIFILLDDESVNPFTARAFNCTDNGTWTPLTATVIIKGVNGMHQVRVKAQSRSGPTRHVNGGYLCVQHL